MQSRCVIPFRKSSQSDTFQLTRGEVNCQSLQGQRVCFNKGNYRGLMVFEDVGACSGGTHQAKGLDR